MRSEIIAVGSEMLTPWRQDTNSLALTEKLNDLGVIVAFKTIVGDRRTDLADAIRIALGRVDIVLLTGGLGPTEDDLTREAVADALGLELRRDHAQVTALYTRAASMRISMPENNLKQADVIDTAVVLPNPNGSAPGQWLDTAFNGYRKLVMLLPGPPGECIPLFDIAYLPRLKELLPPRHIAKRTLRAAMILESQADKILAPIYMTYPDVETTILASGGEIQLTLIAAKPAQDAAQKRVDELAGRLEVALQDWLFASDGESLEEIVLLNLALRQMTLAVAESCTGGKISERLTSISGSSRSFVGGAIAYSNNLKTDFAGVPAEVIARYGAVSVEVAAAMAEGIRKRTGASIGLSVTGIAGPTGGTDAKPVGLVYFSVADAQKTETFERNFRGPRERVRTWAAQQALDLVRRRLM
jgi:nicotinamide-nucleotide amidase